jgi:quinolinate synthase
VADTVQLLCPDARVICPVPGNGCAPDPGTAAILEARQDHPEAALIVGVRSSLEAKTLADIPSTPEIIMEVVEAMEEDEILVAVPGLDTTTLPETWAGGKEIMAVPVLPWDRIEGDSPCSADSGASDVPSHVAEAGRGKGAFFPRHGTICHGKTETTIVDLYRSLVTGEPRVIIPRDLLSQARRPVLRMKDVLGWQP